MKERDNDAYPDGASTGGEADHTLKKVIIEDVGLGRK